MIKILAVLWHLLDNTLYRMCSCILKIFHIEIEPEKWTALMQFVKFGLVGVSNTIIDYISYFIAINIFKHFGLFGDKAYIPSNVIGMLVSVSNAFYWNDRYVFKKSSDQKRSKLTSYFKTVSSYAITCLGLKTILLYLFITVWGISDILAPILIMFIIVPINFIMNKLWAFKSK